MNHRLNIFLEIKRNPWIPEIILQLEINQEIEMILEINRKLHLFLHKNKKDWLLHHLILKNKH